MEFGSLCQRCQGWPQIWTYCPKIFKYQFRRFWLDLYSRNVRFRENWHRVIICVGIQFLQSNGDFPESQVAMLKCFSWSFSDICIIYLWRVKMYRNYWSFYKYPTQFGSVVDVSEPPKVLVCVCIRSKTFCSLSSTFVKLGLSLGSSLEIGLNKMVVSHVYLYFYCPRLFPRMQTSILQVQQYLQVRQYLICITNMRYFTSTTKHLQRLVIVHFSACNTYLCSW